MPCLHMLQKGTGGGAAIRIAHLSPVGQRLWFVIQFLANEHVLSVPAEWMTLCQRQADSLPCFHSPRNFARLALLLLVDASCVPE